MVRKPANFVSSILDDRGEELQYCGISISDVFSQSLGVGGVVSLLWFRRHRSNQMLPDGIRIKQLDVRLLPPACCKFVVTADHGPAVVCVFVGVVVAVSFMSANALLPTKLWVQDFVEQSKKQNKLIMGVGHRIESLANPDQRVVIIKDYAKKFFKDTSILDFALALEQITTKKSANLILNVDGCIAACFTDMLRSCGAFSREEADDLMSFGCLNRLFVLGRSMGFIGHHLDQLRLKQPLYRHPWDA
eukprot:symbB.v1.2.036589.t1/scaffold5200.1/size29896/2